MSLEKFWKIWDKYGLLTILIIVIVTLSCINENFRTLSNFKNFINQAAIAAISAAGMTMAIAAGGFDLSIGSIFALSGCVGALVALKYGVFASVAASLLTGIMLGLLNGTIIRKLKVPPFIATLAMMTILRGVVLIYTGSREINIIGSQALEENYKFLGGGQFLSVPMPIIIMIILYITIQFFLSKTAFGRHVCAIGSNEEAAVTSGLSVDKITIIVFGIVGLTAAISAIVRTSQLMGINGSTAGNGFELEVISVVVLGGTSLSGGKARLHGSLLGALLVAATNNALNLYNTPILYQYLVLGMILLFAVLIDGLRSRVRLKKERG
jgi:ribose transport system permease protein